jgi:NMD protein affecting ribosome stability and mRNA decay
MARKSTECLSYFEGILQLRDVSEDFCETVIRRIREAGKADIACIKPYRTGIDIFLTSARWLMAFANDLRSEGVVETSRKLHTRDSNTGKEVWRVTACFKGVPFRRGQVVHTEDGDVKVLKVGKMIQVQFVKSGKKVSMLPEILREA